MNKRYRSSLRELAQNIEELARNSLCHSQAREAVAMCAQHLTALALISELQEREAAKLGVTLCGSTENERFPK